MLMNFYDEFSDNFFIPCSKITKELWEEMIGECMVNPAHDGKGYALVFCPKDFGYEEDSWCLSSWI